MSPSLSQTASLTCPQCGQEFQAEIWLIVDAAERPDLLERVKRGTLHTLTCPHCGHRGQVDAPLLLYLPPDSPAGVRADSPLPLGEGPGVRADSPLPMGEGPGVKVLFSPAQQTSAEQDQEHARQLLAWLRDSLGDEWQEEWLAQGLPAVPRPLLPTALTSPPAADAATPSPLPPGGRGAGGEGRLPSPSRRGAGGEGLLQP
ncbi:MAG: CpXC domain-containing protein, partial [Chloroflexaceae bacterium]